MGYASFKKGNIFPQTLSQNQSPPESLHFYCGIHHCNPRWGVDPTNIKWNQIFSGSCCTTVDGINPANQYPIMHMVLYIAGGDRQIYKVLNT